MNAEEIREMGFMPFDIDVLTKETILNREVFDYLFTIVDHIQHTELLIQLRNKAKTLGIARNFESLFD